MRCWVDEAFPSGLNLKSPKGNFHTTWDSFSHHTLSRSDHVELGKTFSSSGGGDRQSLMAGGHSATDEEGSRATDSTMEATRRVLGRRKDSDCLLFNKIAMIEAQ